jgi:hypothetical protein
MAVPEWIQLQESNLNSGGNLTRAKLGENHQSARELF